MDELVIPGLRPGVRIAVSIGGSSFPENGTFVEELFAHTAASLNSVMNSGGNAISFSGHEKR